MPTPRTPRTSLSAVIRGVRGGSAFPRAKLRMPGRSHDGPLPALTERQARLAGELRASVERLAGEFPRRNVFEPAQYRGAEEWLAGELRGAGLAVRREVFRAAGQECVNLECGVRGSGSPEKIVVFGAHYDAVEGSPGANDNGSGVAAVLALARRFAGSAAPALTLRFVLFANEEPPFFWTDEMGSLVYARARRARGEEIVGMITPETIGYYTDEPGTQRYPLPVMGLYPSAGNFVAFVGMSEAAEFVCRCVGAFRERCRFPSIGAALPGVVPMVGASDHWSFWKAGYPALMVTDTAPFRYRHYHKTTDTPDRLEYGRMARVVEGLGDVVEVLAAG